MTRAGKRTTMLVAVMIAGVLSASLYVKQNYFFNPLSFGQDKITYLPWHWYKKPVEIEYLVSGDKWKKVAVEDPAEIDFVVSELKKGALLPQPDPSIKYVEGNPMITVDIRQVQEGVNAPGAVLLHAQSDTNLASIRTGQKMKPMQVTNELKSLIEQRIAQAN